MIGVSKLYCGAVEASDPLRYGRESSRLPSHLLQFSKDKKPVVVWNTTKRCNLKCVHCYAHAEGEGERKGELSTEEGKRFLDDLAAFGAPVILFSGGEPLLRKDLPELIDYAVKLGMRAVISTNGTLITEEKARIFSKFSLSYIGVSLDGIGDVNDSFRGVKGAYEKAIEGIRNAKKAGIKVGLRFTINKRNYKEIPAVFDLIEKEGIERVCFYHLVYAGRGSKLIDEDLSMTRQEGWWITFLTGQRLFLTEGKRSRYSPLTTMPTGPFIYLRLLRENKERAEEVYKLLMMNEGNASGVGIGCVDEEGNVHADQFWRHHTFGNVRKRPFSEIWTDLADPLMAKLKEKKLHVKGKCAGAGGFRSAAEISG